jgi:hypothetical protein
MTSEKMTVNATNADQSHQVSRQSPIICFIESVTHQVNYSEMSALKVLTDRNPLADHTSPRYDVVPGFSLKGTRC